MKDLPLYQELLGLCAPWQVTDVKRNLPAQEITVTVACAEGEVWACPACSHRLHVQGWEERTWRHLDTCPCRTLLTARVPRLRCSHPQCPDGSTQIAPVPWAEKYSRFTRHFERLAIAVLLECSFSGAGQILRLSWDEADGIQSRAVRRGLARKAAAPPSVRRVCVDEKSFGRGHDCVTVVARIEPGQPGHRGLSGRRSADRHAGRLLAGSEGGATPSHRSCRHGSVGTVSPKHERPRARRGGPDRP